MGPALNTLGRDGQGSLPSEDLLASVKEDAEIWAGCTWGSLMALALPDICHLLLAGWL